MQALSTRPASNPLPAEELKWGVFVYRLDMRTWRRTSVKPLDLSNAKPSVTVRGSAVDVGTVYELVLIGSAVIANSSHAYSSTYAGKRILMRSDRSHDTERYRTLFNGAVPWQADIVTVNWCCEGFYTDLARQGLGIPASGTVCQNALALAPGRCPVAGSIVPTMAKRPPSSPVTAGRRAARRRSAGVRA